MKSIIVSAKSVEKAIEDGLKALDTTLENVDVNIINEGSLLKKAKVEIILIEETDQKEELKPVVESVKNNQTKPNIDHKQEKTKAIEVAADEEEDLELQSKLLKIEKELTELSKTEDTENKEPQANVLQVAKEFLEGLIYAININATVELEELSNSINAKILGENLGVLIGYHGDGLEAIQYLLNNHVYNKLGRTKKIALDIENYRGKREETLQSMAESIAKKVVQNKRSYKLEAMNSYERKVIHTHLQNLEHIATHSEGKEPNRYLVIDFVE